MRTPSIAYPPPRRSRVKSMARIVLQAVLWLGLPGAGPAAGRELSVHGTIADTRGEPVAGARIEFTYYPDPLQIFYGYTQEDGTYRVDLSELVTAVEEETAVRPGAFQLLPNYPNPFNPSTAIPYHLPEAGHVELSIFNILGQQVRILIDGWQEAGTHAATWDGRDQQEQGLATGVYLSRLRAGQQVMVRKMLLLDGAVGAPRGGVPRQAAKAVQDTLDARHRFAVYISGDVIEPLRQQNVAIPASAPLDFQVIRRFFVSSRTDLTALFPDPENPTTVHGSLYIVGSDLEDLEGLRSLREVEGDLVIYNNAHLKSIAGLRHLVRVERGVGIGANPSLENLDGLHGLTSVQGYLSIEQNEKVQSLEALRAIVRVGETLSISTSPALRSLRGLEGIVEVQGEVRIWENPVLESLEGLDHLVRIGGDLQIIGNPVLLGLDNLRNLQQIGNTLWLQDNPRLTDLKGLRRIERLPHGLQIRFNEQLRRLDGLEQIASVGYTLEIGNNPALESLAALSGIEQVGNWIKVYENPSLRTLDGHTPEVVDLNLDEIFEAYVIGRPDGPHGSKGEHDQAA